MGLKLVSRASDQRMKSLAQLHGWQVRTRPRRNKLNVEDTDKQCFRGAKFSPWALTWGELVEYELAQPKESEKQ